MHEAQVASPGWRKPGHALVWTFRDEANGGKLRAPAGERPGTSFAGMTG